MFTLLIFIIVIGILVLVHELGHFVMAKRAGMKVEEFGFGFPPRLWGFKKGETIYSINWIPFGGFVKIFGESGDGEVAQNPKSFISKKPGIRAGVIVAGVVMNVFLAFALLSLGNFLGSRVGFSEKDDLSRAKDIKVEIIRIAPASPAAEIGLEMLDQILGLKLAAGYGTEVAVKNIADVQQFTDKNKGKNIIIKIKRGAQVLEKQAVPRLNPPAGEGALGISLATTGIIKYSWYQAIYRGANQTGMLFVNTVYGYGKVIKNVFTNGSPGGDLSGPIGIAKFTGQAARLGFSYLLQLMALISVNLAVLNIIPFPALDGGRLLFIGIEKIKGSPISRKVENIVNSVGFALLIMLMIYVTTKDILKFF